MTDWHVPSELREHPAKQLEQKELERENSHFEDMGSKLANTETKPSLRLMKPPCFLGSLRQAI